MGGGCLSDISLCSSAPAYITSYHGESLLGMSAQGMAFTDEKSGKDGGGSGTMSLLTQG
jgi:hypothetical protein